MGFMIIIVLLCVRLKTSKTTTTSDFAVKMEVEDIKVTTSPETWISKTFMDLDT